MSHFCLFVTLPFFISDPPLLTQRCLVCQLLNSAKSEYHHDTIQANGYSPWARKSATATWHGLVKGHGRFFMGIPIKIPWGRGGWKILGSNNPASNLSEKISSVEKKEFGLCISTASINTRYCVSWIKKLHRKVIIWRKQTAKKNILQHK